MTGTGWRRRRVAAATVLMLGVAAPADAQGRLVIAGGGVSAENAALYRSILDGRQGTGPLCVIPTASADRDASRASMTNGVAAFERHGGPGAAIGILMSIDFPETARDPRIVEQLRGCSGFHFTGGVQTRTVAVLRPAGTSTPALDALTARHREGAVIGGSSAGAAVMSDPMIAGGSTTTALARGVRRADSDVPEDEDVVPDGVEVTRGIGFLPGAIVDQHFLARGRIGRLISAVVGMPEFDLGFGVDEDTGLVVDGAAVHVVGVSGVVVVDAREAVHEGRDTRNLRLHLVSTGDRYDLGTRELEPATAKRPLPRSARAVTPPEDVFARWAFLHLLEAFGRAEEERVIVPFEGGELTLRKGPRFVAVAGEGAGIVGTPAGFTVRDLLVDVRHR
jgi:cyanophycinase